jgi:hypothetical protein
MSKVKVTVVSPKEDYAIKPMSEMEPCDICQVAENFSDYLGDYVMRTQSTGRFEVMDLTNFNKNCCWEGEPILKVKPAPVGTKIIIEVTE